MAHSFAFAPPASVPSAARRIALAFKIHPRLRLEDEEDRVLDEEISDGDAASVYADDGAEGAATLGLIAKALSPNASVAIVDDEDA